MPIAIAEATQKAAIIKMLVMDVDGTLTDGAMYYGHEGEVMKRFSTRDGMGLQLLANAGIERAIITSEQSPIVTARAKKLGITNVILGSRNKPESLNQLMAATSIARNEIAFIGDDINDIHVMQSVGLSACVGDASEQVQQVAHYICTCAGGHGAVREFCEFLLHAQHQPIVLPQRW
jgi:3-deoxy-D-manno-octulosonate 8-phosphate phosphatase (KDO 8-P phosphatase)